jgi:hypothetical protein
VLSMRGRPIISDSQPHDDPPVATGLDQVDRAEVGGAWIEPIRSGGHGFHAEERLAWR